MKWRVRRQNSIGLLSNTCMYYILSYKYVFFLLNRRYAQNKRFNNDIIFYISKLSILLCALYLS